MQVRSNADCDFNLRLRDEVQPLVVESGVSVTCSCSRGTVLDRAAHLARELQLDFNWNSGTNHIGDFSCGSWVDIGSRHHRLCHQVETIATPLAWPRMPAHIVNVVPVSAHDCLKVYERSVFRIYSTDRNPSIEYMSRIARETSFQGGWQKHAYGEIIGAGEINPVHIAIPKKMIARHWTFAYTFPLVLYDFRIQN